MNTVETRKLGQPSRRTPGPGDVVLMRRDPPVDAGFIHDTLLLGFMQRKGAQVVNDPRGLRDFNEQLAALEDRKSVVSGKSVPVRVDLGALCFNKKHITTEMQYLSTD